MDITITPGKLDGSIAAIPSKSQAHRLLICAAFSDKPTTLICPQTNQDIEATASCLRALGAHIERDAAGYTVLPITSVPTTATLPCGESGSTLRFMLPIVGALGISAQFLLEGRLPHRPLSPLWEEMERMGCSLSRPAPDTASCSGKLRPGTYTIRGDISSQFITGLLFAMALIPGQSQLNITHGEESKPYITMTQQALSCFGVSTQGYRVQGQFPFLSPGALTVEGDWSNAAFFLAAKALGSNLRLCNLNMDSAQGDRAVFQLCESLSEHSHIDSADIPDLIPVLSVVAAANKGAVFHNIQRLRLKESDRIASTTAMLTALGGRVESSENTMTVFPSKFTGGLVNSMNDHRIAMSAAVAATVADGPVTILDAHCVAKSYPTFWEEYKRLGGHYEQYVR